MMLDQVDIHGADGSHGSEAAEASTFSNAVASTVSASLANGLATGAALVSTGLHAVAELAKTGVSGKEQARDGAEDAENMAENAERTESNKSDGLRLQFGTFDDNLADNILSDAPSGGLCLRTCYSMCVLATATHAPHSPFLWLPPSNCLLRLTEGLQDCLRKMPAWLAFRFTWGTHSDDVECVS